MSNVSECYGQALDNLMHFPEEYHVPFRWWNSLTCGECGYTWNYTGFLRLPRCPGRDTRVHVVEKEEKYTYLRCPHCGYSWPFTGTAKRTICHNCEQKVDTGKNRVTDSDDSDVTVWRCPVCVSRDTLRDTLTIPYFYASANDFVPFWRWRRTFMYYIGKISRKNIQSTRSLSSEFYVKSRGHS